MMPYSKKGIVLLVLLAIAAVTYAAPSAPADINFYQNYSANYAKSAFSVNWTAVTNENISNYSIYVFDSATFLEKASNTSQSGYLLPSITNNRNYSFKISATNTSGDEGTNSTSGWIFADTANPSVTLNSPSDGAWDSDGKVNFTFTATDSTGLNCSLWTDTTGSMLLNMTNSSTINNTPTTFAFDTNTLASGTYHWNVQCFDALNNSAWATQRTFTIGTAPDFIVTGIEVINSSNTNHPDRPIPNGHITLNITVKNDGSTEYSSGNLNVSLLWNEIQFNSTSLSALAAGESFSWINDIPASLATEGVHSAKAKIDPQNTVSETSESNNELSRNVFTVLNVTIINMTPQKPYPGENLLANLSIRYQDGDAATGITMANFTIFDYYAVGANMAPAAYSSALVYSNGYYLFNITASPKNATTNRANAGIHAFRFFIKDNSTGKYYDNAWIINNAINSTGNYYELQAPNIDADFSGFGSSIDIRYAKNAIFDIRVRNNGTINISQINISVISSLDGSLSNGGNVSKGIVCKYNSSELAPTNIWATACNPVFNYSAIGNYTITLMAGGIDINGTPYNSTSAVLALRVYNGSATSVADTLPANTKYNYTLEFYRLNKTIILEQGSKTRIPFFIQNIGNGSVNNITFALSFPDKTSWGKWYNTSIVRTLLPNNIATFYVNISIPPNASITPMTITAKAAGIEAGSSKTATFILQVSPGLEARKAINATLASTESEAFALNSTLSKLLEKSSNLNLTVASKKLSEIIRLSEDARRAILRGDYLSAYNTQKDIDSLITEVRKIVANEIGMIEATSKTIITIASIIIVILAIAGIIYYLWMPEEGYTPGKGYVFRPKSNSPVDKIMEQLNKYVRMIFGASKKDMQDMKYAAPKEQPYNFSQNTETTITKLKKMLRNIFEQLKKGKDEGKPGYNFHKKQTWSND